MTRRSPAASTAFTFAPTAAPTDAAGVAACAAEVSAALFGECRVSARAAAATLVSMCEISTATPVVLPQGQQDALSTSAAGFSISQLCSRRIASILAAGLGLVLLL